MAYTTYSYDANGNTQVINAGGSLTTNTWDIENRLTVVQLPAGTRTTASYDGDGKRRRYEDNQDARLRNFLWDGENIARQTDVNGATDRDYTYNPQLYGELVGQSRLFHHFDALGSTRNLTDAGQTVTDTRDYKAFGETNASSGTNPNRFWWVGRLGYYLQPDTGDYWVRARVYRPQIGRWVTRDPLVLSDVDRYLHVRNNVPNSSDASGLLRCLGLTPCSELRDPDAKPPYNNPTKCGRDALKEYIEIGCGPGGPGGAGGVPRCSNPNAYAWTDCCCEKRKCWYRTSHCQPYNEAPKCIQTCIRLHEKCHAEGCLRTGVITGESECYYRDCRCACDYYRMHYGGAASAPAVCRTYPPAGKARR